MKIIIEDNSNLPAKISLLMIERVMEKDKRPKFSNYRHDGKSYEVVYTEKKDTLCLSIDLIKTEEVSI